MPIKNSKETDLGPFTVQVHFILRFHNVEDDAHPVFIVLSNDTLVGICCVSFNYAAFLHRGFGYLMVLKDHIPMIDDGRILSE